jgi:quinone-modifying oxidoreductase subunit QmoC
VVGGITTVETAAETSQVNPEVKVQGEPHGTPSPVGDSESILVDPDLDFIRRLSRKAGDSYKKCMQCGTCSASCSLSPDSEPFPRKEMIWAAWGLRDRLLTDLDVWLCYQCNDCSTRCPRSARPGDVLAAIRQEVVIQYSAPHFLARWVNQARYIPILLGIPVLLLGLLIFAKEPIGNVLGFSSQTGAKIVYSYSSTFPHWLLNSFFIFFGVLVLLVATVGIARFWRDLRVAGARNRVAMPVKGVGSSMAATLRNILTHSNFPKCETEHSRFLSHALVFFGFAALTAVTIWVITAGYNFLIHRDFVYPFSFWSPWKILANLGGAALFAGCLLMIRDRLRENEHFGTGTYFDWALIATLLIVVVTGFITELLHYARMEPHRHIAYFIHLVFVFELLVYLPYSKLAHLLYRTTALVYAEHIGRKKEEPPVEPGAG